MTIGELVGYVTLDARQFTAGLRQVDKVVMKNQATMRRLAVGMLAVGAALAIALGKVIKTAAEFETAMRRVNTIMMLSDRALASMTEEVKDLAVEFGRLPTDLAKGLYDIGSASFYGAEGMMVLEASARAAVAGITTTKIAADALTTVLNAYGMEASEAASVSDTLFTTVKYGKVTFAELAQNIGQASTTAAIAGVPFEEIGAAFATITRAGLNAAETGTAINRMMLAFLKPTDRARKAAAEFGFELSAEALQSMKLSGALAQLVDRFAITEQQLDRIIATTESEAEAMEQLGKESGIAADAIASIFPNVRALRAILPLMRQGGREFAKDLENMANKAGLTEEAFLQMQQTLEHNWNQFIASWQNLKQELGVGFLPMLRTIVKGMTGMSEGARDLPGPLKAVGTALGTVTAAGLLLAGGATVLRLSYKGLAGALAPLVKGLSALAGVSTIAASGLLALVGGAVAFAVAANRANKEAAKFNTVIKRQNKEAKELGIELTKMPDVLSGGWRMRLAGQRAAKMFGLPTGDFINKVYDLQELREQRLEQVREAQEKKAKDVEEAEKEAERALLVRRKALEDLAQAEEDLYTDDTYKEFLARNAEIEAQQQDLYERLLGGPKRYREVMRAVKAGNAEMAREAKDAEEKSMALREKAYKIARDEYEAQAKEDLAQEERDKVAAWEQIEQKKLALSELYADYALQTGKENFDQYVARINAVIAHMRRIDEERQKQGMEPMYQEELIRQEMALYQKREQNLKSLRMASEKDERDRVAGARRVIAALREQDGALKELMASQTALVNHSLEMGEITEAEYARNMGRILDLMRKADQAREKYSQPPMFLEQTWSMYEQLYRRQIDAAEELARLEEERFDDEKAHLATITGLREDMLDIELDVRDREFRRKQAQIRLEYDDREDREAALAAVQREHAAAIIKDVTEGKVTDVRERIEQLDKAVGLLRSAGEAGEDVGRTLDTAYKLIDENLAEQEDIADRRLRAALKAEEIEKERFATQRVELDKTITAWTAALKGQAKDTATQFFNELSARIKDLGKVFLKEMGKVVVPAGGPGTRQAAGAGGVVINLGGGAGVGVNERDLLRRIRDMLTDELTRARS